jgi:hypothetical protein
MLWTRRQPPQEELGSVGVVELIKRTSHAGFDVAGLETGPSYGSPRQSSTLPPVAKMKAGAGGPLADYAKSNERVRTVHKRVKNEGILQMPVLLDWARNDPSAQLARGGSCSTVSRKRTRGRGRSL